jgi:probable F420-dependent oxidoreductase
MRIGIGLPTAIPGIPGRILIEWARLSEKRGFSVLATIDRVAFPSYESLIVLATAAAVTETIGLLTNILLGPTRTPVLLAKEAASVDQISGGRLTLGLGVGARQDDYTATGQAFKTRGRRLDEALELIHLAWRGEPVAGSPKPVAPAPVQKGGIPILIGGYSEQAIKRTVRWGIGWTASGVQPDQTGSFAERIRRSWQEAGREGKPQIVALTYYALGKDAQAGATTYIKEYYDYLGPWADQIAKSVSLTASALQTLVKRFEDVGVDEVILAPTIAQVDQVDLLADALL